MSSPSLVTLDPNRNTAEIVGPGSYQLLTIPANEMLRLLRKDWKGPNGATMLSEEIYAIMGGAVAKGQQTGQLNLQQPAPGVYPLVINTGPDGNGIALNGPNGTTHIGPNGITLPGGGKAPVAVAGTGGGGVPGQVVSGGPGDTYQVNIFENGVSAGATATVTVKQLQIDPAETIPAGTWAIVSKSGSGYVMQVPVWLA